MAMQLTDVQRNQWLIMPFLSNFVSDGYAHLLDHAQTGKHVVVLCCLPVFQW